MNWLHSLALPSTDGWMEELIQAVNPPLSKRFRFLSLDRFAHCDLFTSSDSIIDIGHHGYSTVWTKLWLVNPSNSTSSFLSAISPYSLSKRAKACSNTSCCCQATTFVWFVVTVQSPLLLLVQCWGSFRTEPMAAYIPVYNPDEVFTRSSPSLATASIFSSAQSESWRSCDSGGPWLIYITWLWTLFPQSGSYWKLRSYISLAVPHSKIQVKFKLALDNNTSVWNSWLRLPLMLTGSDLLVL